MKKENLRKAQILFFYCVQIVSPKSNDAYKSITPPCNIELSMTEEVLL